MNFDGKRMKEGAGGFSLSFPRISGVVKCPMTWVYWTSPYYSSHKKDH